MAQPLQVFNVNGAALIDIGQQWTFSVIDNGQAGNIDRFGQQIAGSGGYDKISFGATAQGTNKFANGTIPDCVNTAPTTIQAASVSGSINTTIKFKNPA
jgi:hypothetical protein